MYLGEIVEIGNTSQIFINPKHPYTKALLSAIPIPDPKVERKRDENRLRLEGEVPSPINAPKGCKFCTRCRFATDRCKMAMPLLKDEGNGHFVACHLYDDKV